MQEMPVKDDGNGQDYLCALRLAVRKQGLDQQKALPQSARSRCVKPCRLIQGPKSLLATAKWNEVFVFEVPKQVSFNSKGRYLRYCRVQSSFNHPHPASKKMPT